MLEASCRPLRGDLLVRWSREAEGEIPQVSKKDHAHQSEQGAHPFSISSSFLSEDHTWVGFLCINLQVTMIVTFDR